MRQFTELSYDDFNYKLEIYCTMLEAGETDELVKSLEEKSFKLTYINNDSIRGELELAQYPQIVKVRKQLSNEGFSWSENAKRIKLSVE
ncbi:hypothetical protein ES695_00595 [Candidatus Atribacteria bacterium 1244-E10-H5-B2]|nr:MAG: hypothetical protein ES695_00595 [Candidatus Atribacteria bacterium 1244-E10-H5-B2]